MDELVSIIMPSYNTGKFIKESIECVLKQSYSNFELIIVDDCSSDNTDSIVMSFSDPRICFIKNKVNNGAAVSRNKALLRAKGKWVAFLDSDDLWDKDKLRKQIDFMVKNNYHFSFTNYCEIDEQGCFNGILWTGPKKVNSFLMRTFNYMGCLTVMYDRDYVGTIQIADIKKRNDYAMWVKVSKKCPAYLLNENLALYRIRTTGSIMNRGKNPLSRFRFNYYLWRKSEQKSVFVSCILTAVNFIFGIFKKVIYKRTLKETA